MNNKKKRIDPTVLQRKIQEVAFSIRMQQNCKAIGAQTVSDLLEKMKNPATLSKFGEKSRKEIRRKLLEMKVALDENFQPLMHLVHKKKAA